MTHAHPRTTATPATSLRQGACRVDPRTARSRAAVLDATLCLLAERGIAATTIEAVASRSGVAKTTIYRQWDGQPALVLDAIASTMTAPPPVDTGTLRGDLVELVTSLVGALRTGPAARLMAGLVDAAERDDAFAALHRREAHERHQPIRDVITRGIARGELPAGTDVDDVLDLLAGPVFHRRWMSQTSVEPAFAERLVDLVLVAFRQGSPTAGR